MLKNLLSLAILFIVTCSCKDDSVPKPNAFLRLEYPEATYKEVDLKLPFTFEKNTMAEDVKIRQLDSATNSFGIDLSYPKLKGTIFLTYKGVDQNKDKLIAYLRDAQKFTQEHTRKADEISEQVYESKDRRVYGMFYEVGGNAASQSQFYITDSINHFLTGSLYFYAKPNYDSILPAAHYLEKDIRYIMETVKWK